MIGVVVFSTGERREIELPWEFPKLHLEIASRGRAQVSMSDLGGKPFLADIVHCRFSHYEGPIPIYRAGA